MGEFGLSADEAGEEIGETGMVELQALAKHLTGKDVPVGKLQFRYAPSLVVRSEAELLGISEPRFALRVYLPGGGFVNARRLDHLSARVTKWSCRQDPSSGKWRRLSQPTVVSIPDLSPEETLRSSSCVADSLLVATAGMKESYHVLEADLGWCYGESGSLMSTPYMKHVRLSGLCAQAVCLMAGSLHHGHDVDEQAKAKPAIHGVAEVSAVLADEFDAKTNEMVLSGLQAQEIVRYLDAVGRSAWQESCNSPHNGFAEDQSLQLCLASYVRSGMPVILLVNAWEFGQLVTEYQTNGANPDEKGFNHAVLVIGVGRKGRTGDVLIHDPARLPFLPVAESRLISATRARGKSTPDHAGDVPDTAGSMIPVLPHHVRLGLDCRVDTMGNEYAGLLHLATKAQVPLWPAVKPWKPGEFLLVRKRDIEAGTVSQYPWAPKVLEKLNRVTAEHWVWLQTRPGEVWAWDAQMACDWHPVEADAVEPQAIKDKFLLGIASRVRATFSSVFMPPPGFTGFQTTPVRIPSVRHSPAPKPAMISSTCLDGFQRNMDWWPRGVPCEVYAFAHNDEIFAKYSPKKADGPDTSVARLARLMDRPEIEMLAGDLIAGAAKRESPIIGLASFIPEILPVAAPPHKIDSLLKSLQASNSTTLSEGQQAVVALIQLSRALIQRQKHPPTSAFTIELVGGSRVGGVWPAHIPGANGSGTELAYFLNRYTSAQAIDGLAYSVKRILRHVAPNDNDRFVLSFELEPGGNFTLAEASHLERFFGHFPESNRMCRYVGINLDISHWNLAGIRPDSVSFDRYRSLMNRLCHVHISDVGRAHFGDAPLGDIAGPRRAAAGGPATCPGTVACTRACFDPYEPWLDVIADSLASRNRRLPGFSGYVSLELEAAKNSDQAYASLARLQSLLWKWEA